VLEKLLETGGCCCASAGWPMDSIDLDLRPAWNLESLGDLASCQSRAKSRQGWACGVTATSIPSPC